MTITCLLAFAWVTNMTMAADAKTNLPPTRKWLAETAELIEKHYWNDKEKVYVETVDAAGKPGGQPAFMWAMGVLLSGYAQAIKVDRKTYLPLFDKAFQSIEPYWSEARGLKGYSVLPRQTDPDRYYDDNAWVALALCEAFETTKDRKYLERAAETYAFVVSCEDDKLGGGLYWHEPERKGKNTCTNAPAINVALRLYRATKDKRYLADAQRLYDWVQCLQDKDGLFFDNISLEGKIEQTKWTYNTALMIRANCLFYQVTKAPKYRDEAVRIALSAFQRWHRPETGALADEACFAHHLFEAFYEVATITRDRKWIDRVLPAIQFVRDGARTGEGYYGHRWDRRPDPDTNDLKLIFQASALRAFAVASTKK